MSIAAIIPAYNEEKTITNVLDVVRKVDIIDRIIVVSDGSTDNTAKVALNMGADVINLKTNLGKGGAMKAGLDNCSADIILFLDADLIGLTYNHILGLLDPLINNRADMSIGVFKDGRLFTDLAQKITPFLSGQRAVRSSMIKKIPHMDISKFGIEVALTRYALKNNIKIEHVGLSQMTHHTKEEKLGLVRGISARMKMYWDIVKCLKPERIK